ncbi:hypothetical protein BV25DRAFT_571363 [Artomyces pyxidatus]|uniref:Uncharacterized protein n=1 Tax=Artomyces pyxidatus TaxID=48021 RepID=A0ACB8TIY0_9AGAM|nr:hypothetical protein BV25DRAFT_571363 [Artomyces pyxidatus]
MLWRVGRGCRQSLHPQASAHAPILLRSSFVLALVNQVVHTRWSHRMALATQHTHTPAKSRHATASNDLPPLTDVSIAASKAPIRRSTTASRGGKPGDKAHLPPELLAVIDSALIWTASKQTLSGLLDSIPGKADFSRVFADNRKVGKLAGRMIDTPAPRRALRVLVIADRLECALKREQYEALAHQLAAVGEWTLIVSIVALARRQLGRLNGRLLDWRIRALTKAGKFFLLDDMLEQFEKDGQQPSKRTFQLLASGYIRNRNLPKAMEVLQKMSEAGFQIDPSTHAVVTAAYRTLGPDEALQTQALEALGTADSRTATYILNALMQLSLDAHDTKRLTALLELFDLATLMSPILPSAGSTSPHDGDNVASSLPFIPLRHLSAHRVVPDVATYTILLNHVSVHRHLSTAFNLSRHLKEADIIPDSLLVAALVRVHFAIDRPDIAFRIMSSLCTGNTEAQDILTRVGPTSSGRKDCNHLPPINIKLTTAIFNAFVDGIISACGLEGMWAALQLMRACSVSPDGQTAELFVGYLKKEEGALPGQISRILRDLLSTTTSPISIRHLDVILEVVLRREVRRAKRSGWNNTEALIPRGRDPTNPKHGAPAMRTDEPFDPTAGVQLTTRSPSLAQFAPLLRSVADRGARTDRSMLALRIRHDAVSKNDISAAKDAFQIMLNRGLHPTHYHFSALMEGYVATGELRAAEALMDAAARGGVRPNQVMYTILIVGHARRRDPDRALEVLREMVAAGIKPDIPVVDAIASAFFAVGEFRAAHHILMKLWPHGAPLPDDLYNAPLKVLVQRLRSLHPGGRITKAVLSGKKRRPLSWKLDRIMEIWKLTTRLRGEEVVVSDDYRSTKDAAKADDLESRTS